jgi:hypothetical protein
LRRTPPLDYLAPGLFALPTTLAQQQAQQAAAIYTALNSGLSGSSTTRGDGVDPWSNKVGVVTSSANSDYNSLQVSVSRAVEVCFFSRTPTPDP